MPVQSIRRLDRTVGSWAKCRVLAGSASSRVRKAIEEKWLG
ncbi:hypothetical protein RE6C_01924 [Rhodopirellula europaea 6C]|uniref:Uncharacterized protein n=1 Tax=Rhodopirellula europaea 6C TaxID=1263867 RepID=M2A7K8_9BACT|nr:hypothetical protein RE6C_01924 [Rhodopirellula europaea 6C]